jgi:hypothetical protein
MHKNKNNYTLKKSNTNSKPAIKTHLHTYIPTINKLLVPLKSINRKTIHTKKCNKNPFALKNNEEFKIEINGVCYSFFEKQAINYLLHNLSANKHVDVNKLITPKQYDANCWFNVMFVTFFISDKGRIFFHFLRQLMITGTQANGDVIHPELWKTFSLLNYYIDISAKGDSLAKKINTNSIILKIYHVIKNLSQNKSHLNSNNNKIYKKSEPGNPVVYYTTIINFLNNKDINILKVYCAVNWKQSLETQLYNYLSITKGVMPHIILLEFSYSVSNNVEKTRGSELFLNNSKYKLDSACVIDVEREHFCSCLTIEGIDYMYDGMSNHRIIKKQWKTLLNSPIEWSFKGSHNYDGTLKKWSFLNGYHILFYYMV